MARKKVLSKDQILECSFMMINTIGLDKVTIRAIANELGTSTAPIYSHYEKMSEIKDDLSHYVDQKLMNSLQREYTDNPFYNIGVGLLTFASDYKKVFQTYYLTNNTLITRIVDSSPDFINNMRTDPFLSLLNEDRLQSLIDDMWVYTFGLAAIICINNEPDNLKSYLDQLEKTGERLIMYHLFSTGNIEKCFTIISQDLHKCAKKVPCN